LNRKRICHFGILQKKSRQKIPAKNAGEKRRWNK